MTAGSDTQRDRTTASDPCSAGAAQESGFLDDVGAWCAELRKELEAYLAIKVASLRLSFWKSVVAIVSVILGVVFASAFLATAVVFLFSGLAGWLGEVTSKPYLGSLLAGLVGVLLVGVALAAVRSALLKKANDAARNHERGHDRAR